MVSNILQDRRGAARNMQPYIFPNFDKCKNNNTAVTFIIYFISAVPTPIKTGKLNSENVQVEINIVL